MEPLARAVALTRDLGELQARVAATAAERVEAIRAARAAGVPVRAIAEALGVHRVTVYDLLREREVTR